MNKELFKNKKLIFAVVLIILTIILSVTNNFTKNDNTNKKIKNKKYVFTLESSSDNNSKLPYINLKGDSIEKLNIELKEKYYKIISNTSLNSINYEVNINSGFISLLIIEQQKESENDIPDIVYTAYYIEINTMKLLNQEDIIKKYNLNLTSIEKQISTELNNQYNKEVTDGYIVKQECDYNCYLEYRKYNSINDNLQFYIKENKVYGYLNLTNKIFYYASYDYPKYKDVYSF